MTTAWKQSKLDGMNGFPLELLFDHVCPFLDRHTLNNCLLISKEAYKCLTSEDRPTPPWPRKLVSRDHMCRIRSIVFSPNGNELACGCCDGNIRVWHVWTGEQPSMVGHWPGEAVIALTYSNTHSNNHHKKEDNNAYDCPLLASSSTDHTIRLWTQRCLRHRPYGPSFYNPKQTNQQSIVIDDAMNANKNITIQIRDAGHAYALMFSPDDSYLVSGHHPQQQQQPRRNRTTAAAATLAAPPNELQRPPPQQPQQNLSYLVPETIYLWSVATGLQLRRLENGGMPVGFLHPSQLPGGGGSHHHRLLSSCAGECLKLWNLSEKKNNSTTSSSNTNQCLQRLFLDGYTTVMPKPASPQDDVDSNNNNNTIADIMVASIDGADSFTVWNTGGNGPSSSSYYHQTFQNTSPYEIKFTNNCTKVASVDNFTQVKVWNVQTGKLLKTFVQESTPKSGSNQNNNITAGPTHGVGRCFGGFPIHELAFCQDSTVAVVSRFYNEIHLFST